MKVKRSTYIDGDLYESVNLDLGEDSEIVGGIKLLGVYAVSKPLGRFNRVIEFEENNGLPD